MLSPLKNITPHYTCVLRRAKRWTNSQNQCASLLAFVSLTFVVGQRTWGIHSRRTTSSSRPSHWSGLILRWKSLASKLARFRMTLIYIQMRRGCSEAKNACRTVLHCRFSSRFAPKADRPESILMCKNAILPACSTSSYQLSFAESGGSIGAPTP